MPDETRSGEAVPAAWASRIAHQCGKDVVIIFSLDHFRKVCHATGYGRTDEDRRIAERLAELLAAGLTANPVPLEDATDE